MKKVIIYLLTVVMALSCLAMLPVYASDNLTPDATDVTKWTGWTEYQGGYRKSATATLPDGTEGTVFETGCAPDGTNTYGKINNEYTVTGLEPNTSYVLSATVKVTAPEAAYGSDGFIKGVWSNLGLGIGMAFDGTWQNRFFEKKFDGVWHTYQLGIVTPDSVTNDAEYIVVLGTINGEQYIQNDIYVQLCDMSMVKYDLADNLLGRNGSPVFAEVAGNSGEVLLDKWAGWVDYQGGYRKVSYDDEKGTVIEIGNGSETYTYSAYCNNIGLKGFEASKTYVCTVNVKLTGGAYDTNGNATALNGGFMGSGIDFGDGFQGIYFKQENEGKWCKYEFEVNTSDAVSADTMYAFAVGAVNSQYVANDTILLIGETSIVEKKAEDIPEVEGNLIEKAAAAITEGTTLTAGWGDSPAETPAEYGYDAAASKTFDGTGSAYITLGVKKHQILNVASVELIGGHTYEFSGWIKTSDDFATDGHGGEGATLTWGDNLPTTDWITTAADWTYVKGTYTPETSGTYSLQFRIWGAMTSAWVDEVAVVDVTPEPENVIVSAIDITGFDVPVAGEAPDKEITIDAPEGAVSDYEIIWYVRVEDEWEEFDGDVFEEDTKYGAQIEIYLNDGFEFGEEVTVTVSDGEINDGEESVVWEAQSLCIDMDPVTTDVTVPDTSDAAIIVLAVMALALAATVVFSRKRKED